MVCDIVLGVFFFGVILGTHAFIVGCITICKIDGEPGKYNLEHCQVRGHNRVHTWNCWSCCCLDEDCYRLLLVGDIGKSRTAVKTIISRIVNEEQNVSPCLIFLLHD